MNGRKEECYRAWVGLRIGSSGLQLLRILQGIHSSVCVGGFGSKVQGDAVGTANSQRKKLHVALA